MLIFAGLGVSAQSVSGEGSVHSDLCGGAGTVCKSCCIPADVPALKNTTLCIAVGPMGESARCIPRCHKFQ